MARVKAVAVALVVEMSWVVGVDQEHFVNAFHALSLAVCYMAVWPPKAAGTVTRHRFADQVLVPLTGNAADGNGPVRATQRFASTYDGGSWNGTGQGNRPP